MSKRKTIHASIKGQLLQIAKSAGKNHQLLLLRYFLERFLFRLSKSEYSKHFCLKGAAFLYALEGQKSRVTKDIDFLGIGIPSNHESMLQAVLEICKKEYEDDGVTFDLESISIDDILKDGNYQGVRISVTAHLERTKQRLQIDVGFGDRVIPAPMRITYPVILELEAPELLTYSIESTIAEKFEAMIDLGEINTRMKDFYDIYHLLKNHEINYLVLEEAIRETFKHRKTSTPQEHGLFKPTFFMDEERNRFWIAWLKKTKLDDKLPFEEVLKYIVSKLKPIYLQLSKSGR